MGYYASRLLHKHIFWALVLLCDAQEWQEGACHETNMQHLNVFSAQRPQPAHILPSIMYISTNNPNKYLGAFSY
jgi:hypothetical protein